MPNSHRKCSLKSCSTHFRREEGIVNGLKAFCSDEHRIAWAMEAGRKLVRSKASKEKRAALERLKTRSDYMKEAQKSFNRYVRLRDYGKPCIACGNLPAQKFGGTMDCSHYRSVGSAPHMRFHLHNAHSGCVKCNRDLSGNIVEMRKGMIARIGVQKVEAVEADETIRRFDIEYLKRIKSIFNKKANRIEKKRGANG